VIRSLRGARGPGDTPLVLAWTGPSNVRARPGSPVFVTAELLEQLRHLTADPDRADALASALSALCVEVGVAVPSWTSVSIVLASSGDADVEVAIVASDGRGDAHVVSSLAVPLSQLDRKACLVIRARVPGAFLLLADDLASRLGDAPRIIVDGHLDLALDRETAAGMVAGLGVVDQAIGFLLDRGLSPPQAREDLERRAATSGVSVAAAARSLLEGHARPPDGTHVDTDQWWA
jgi:hypothetical protein